MEDEVKEAANGVEAAAEAAPGPATEARQIYNPSYRTRGRDEVAAQGLHRAGWK